MKFSGHSLFFNNNFLYTTSKVSELFITSFKIQTVITLLQEGASSTWF